MKPVNASFSAYTVKRTSAGLEWEIRTDHPHCEACPSIPLDHFFIEVVLALEIAVVAYTDPRRFV